MSNYTIQKVVGALGTSAAPVTLTGSYSTANSVKIDLRNMNRITVYVNYTMGTAETGNTVDFKLEWAGTDTALSATTWVRDVSTVITSGSLALSLAEYHLAATGAAGTYDRIRIPVEVNDAYLKISVKETGIASNGGKCWIQVTYASE